MTRNLLFPPLFKIIGLLLVLPGAALAIIILNGNGHVLFAENVMNTFLDEISITLLVIGLLFMGFAKQKNENEETDKARLEALFQAILINCLFYILYFIFDAIPYGKVPHLFPDISKFFLLYNLFLLLLVFVTRFYISLYYLKKGNKLRKLYFLSYKPYFAIIKIISASLLIVIFFSAIFNTIGNAIGEILKPVPEIFGMLLPIFLLFSLWSREKKETDIITKMKLSAMQISVYICYGLFLILTWVVYGFDYLFVLILGFVGLVIIFFIIFYMKLFIARLRLKQQAISN